MAHPRDRKIRVCDVQMHTFDRFAPHFIVGQGKSWEEATHICVNAENWRLPFQDRLAGHTCHFPVFLIRHFFGVVSLEIMSPFRCNTLYNSVE